MVSLYEERIAICKQCPSFESITTLCKECGCIMALKARIRNCSCPLNKWKRKSRNMAYFAELDFNNVVTQVVVVNDDVIGDSVYPESEPLGIEFLKSLYGQHTVWKQTSPTGEYRKYFAQLSGLYNPALDIFVVKKPYNSWIFNPVDSTWEAPIPMPEDDNSYAWDEGNLTWVQTESKA